MNRGYDQGLGLLFQYIMMFFVCTGFFIFLFRRGCSAWLMYWIHADKKQPPHGGCPKRGAIQIRTGE